MSELQPLTAPVEPEEPVSPFGGTVTIHTFPDQTFGVGKIEFAETADTSEAVRSVAGDTAIALATQGGESRRARRTFREWVATSWVGRTAATATTALTFYGITGAAEAPAANAATTMSAEIIDTAGSGLWLHTGSPTGPLDRTMPDGDHLDATCFEQGPSVSGYVDWLRGTDEASGDVGFASDAYLYTNTDTSNETAELEAQGLPVCNTATPVGVSDGSFLGVSNTPNGDTISVGSNMAAAPWNFPTQSIHNEIDHVAWVVNPAGYGMTLEVFPTETGLNDSRYDPNYAFEEAAADGNLDPSSPYWNTLESQFICHSEVVSAIEPSKSSWNLDTGRPDLGVAGDMAASCNPIP